VYASFLKDVATVYTDGILGRPEDRYKFNFEHQVTTIKFISTLTIHEHQTRSQDHFNETTMASLTAPHDHTLPDTASSTSNDFDPATHLTLSDQKDLLNETKLDETKLKQLHVSENEFDSASVATTLAPSGTTFVPSRTLILRAHGMPLVRLPIPSRELELHIEDPKNPGVSAYVSTRQKMSSGNAVLSAAGVGDVIRSVYKFGPGRAPRLELLRNEGGEVSVKGKWMSRKQDFVLHLASGKEKGFAWRYSKEVKPGAAHFGLEGAEKEVKPRSFLVCESSGTRVAMLIRDEETRTPGSSSTSAGNGGELLIDEVALGEAGIREELVVATCIMMLKKEMDRRRGVQFAILAGMAGGS
jgi:hypothetical protein